MNVITRATMTLQEFLVWEEQQEERWEFDGNRPVAMTGGTMNHSLIQVGLLAALVPRLRGGLCRVHGSHLKLQLQTTARYPDAFVSCASIDPAALAVTEAIVIFEVLSPNTKAQDLFRKTSIVDLRPSSVTLSSSRPKSAQRSSAGRATSGLPMRSPVATRAWICPKSASL